MTISPRGMISGSVGLCFEYIAQIQEAEAKMQANFLSMFSSGPNGQAGLLEIEGQSNTLGLKFANDQADDIVIQGWEQFGGAAAQAVVGFGSMGLGSNAAAEDEEAANQKQVELNKLLPPPEAPMTVNAEADPEEIEMTTFKSSTHETDEVHAETKQVADVRAQAAANERTDVREEDTKTTSAKIKELREDIATRRQTAESIRGRYQFFGQTTGTLLKASTDTAGAYANADATRAQGQAAMAKGTAELYNTDIGLVNSAISNASSTEQGTVGLYSSIIQLSGAARG